MGCEMILLVRKTGKIVDTQSLHMAELTDKELKELLRDCKEETERRKSGSPV